MTRQVLRNTYPFHNAPQVTRGYRPPPVRGETFSSILAGIVMWGVIIAAAVTTALPILKWLSHA
jgi:hypothetical protein